MKFIHVGDLHLGACPETERGWGEERKKDIEQSLSEVIGWPMKNRQTSCFCVGISFTKNHP